MKSKLCKAMNREVRRFNKQLEKDVFGKRFCIRQVEKQRLDGVEYFRYELIDNENTDRNMVIAKWFSLYSDFSIRFSMSDLFRQMNNFIVTSDFWEKYRSKTHNDEK